MTIRWPWLIPLLLLLALLTVPQLDINGLWYDELFSVNNAGGAQYGPPSLTWIYERVLTEDPYQALGYPYLMGIWGSLTGWSEMMVRTLSFLVALISVTITYRAGRDITGSSAVALAAAVVMGLSTFTIHYAHEARTFTIVQAGSVWLLWMYHHLLRDKNPRTRYKVGFVAAGTLLLWSHYYTIMMLAGLGVYHLLFVEKNRRWWQITGLALLVGVLFLPQLPVFLEGFTRYQNNPVANRALSTPGVLQDLLYYIGNGIWPVTLVVLAAGVYATFRRFRSLQMVLAVSSFGLIILLISNVILDIIEPSRLRYAMFAWPGLSLVAGAGIVTLARWMQQAIPLEALTWRHATLLLCVLWSGLAVRASLTPGFTDSIAGTDIPRMRSITEVLKDDGAAGDLLAFYNGTRSQAWYMQIGMEYVASEIPMPWLFTATRFDPDESSQAWAQQRIQQTERIWYGVNRTIPMMEYHRDFLLLLPNQGFKRCDSYLDNAELGLTLWARSYAFCPSENEIMSFGDGAFRLAGYEATRDRNSLEMAFGWQIADSVPPDTYSFGVYLTPQDSNEILAQTDVGFPDVQFAPLRAQFSTLDEIPPGTYEIRLAVYEWRTGERLPGRVADDSTGDFLLLDTVEIE